MATLGNPKNMQKKQSGIFCKKTKLLLALFQSEAVNFAPQSIWQKSLLNFIKNTPM